MRSVLLPALAVFCAPQTVHSAATRPDSLQESYFSAGWTQTAAPAAAPVPKPPHPVPGAESDKHEKLAHMFITHKAFELFNDRFPGSELARYIGVYNPDEPPVHGDGSVIAGSYDEDLPHENPWDDMAPMVRHFWNWRGGFYAGIYGADSSVNRAHKYFSGGYGIEGEYDDDWSENTGARRGVQNDGILTLYRRGEKAKAYWYLGHVAHLLEDLTVPAHEHLWPHADPGSDRYESYMATQYGRWDAAPSKAIESFPNLYQLFEWTARVSERFDAGFGPGDEGGIDGTADKGRRRKRGFTNKDLDEEADVLMPLAYERVASLFRLFFKEIDVVPPKATLRLRRASDGAVVLSATAFDEVSGVDRLGFRFESAAPAGGDERDWKPLGVLPTSATLRFRPRDGVSYALRVKAVDGAGNVGISPTIYLTAAEAPLLAHAR